MSSTAGRGVGSRAVQAGALLATSGLLLAANQLTQDPSAGVGTVAGLGLLLLAGTLLSELMEVVGLPHLSGYLLAGVLAGPHVLHVVDHPTVEGLAEVNALALALIALAGGAELRLDGLRAMVRSLSWATLLQTVVVLGSGVAAFMALTPFIPFAETLEPRARLVAALLWGGLALARSPAAVLGLMSQLRPAGPLTSFTLAYVMSSNLVVVVLMALLVAGASALLDPSAGAGLQDLSQLGNQLLGSLFLGTALGVMLSVYLHLVGRQLLLVLLLLGFGLSALLQYVRYDPLLSFMVAGFVVQNFSPHGEKLRVAIQKTGAVVFVIFFAIAGAELDLGLLGRVWPVALALAGVRAAATWLAARGSSALSRDPAPVRTWGWSGLVAQAGLALGLVVSVERSFPEFGADLRTLVVAVVAVNEVVGPILLKLGLDASKESGKAGEEQPAQPELAAAR